MSGNTMNEWFGGARDDLAGRGPDAMVESQLLARVRERSALRAVAATHAGGPVGRPRPWWMRLSFGVPLAVAATLVLMAGTQMLAPVAPSSQQSAIATPFIALVTSEALATARAPVVVESQVARTALADYGLPVDPARVDEPVDAEFLVSRTGVVLAVRFKE